MNLKQHKDMAYDKGMITAPVSIADVQRALGNGKRDLGTLCTDTSINKWAWYKPIDFTKVGMLTEGNRQTKYYGLFFRENTDAESLLKSTSPTVDLFNAAAASSYEWSYIPPKGGAASPYRLTDFVGETNNMGYKHGTKPPFEIFGDWSVKRSQLNNVANVYSVASTSSGYNWGLTIKASASGAEIYAGNLFVGYRMKYNTQPQYDINGPDSMAIPMTYLLGAGGVNTEEDYWRVGMIVFVPASGTRSAFVGLFVSKKTFIASKSGVNGENVRDLSVEMCTNQELAFMMNDYMSNKNLTDCTFRALPVLVRDVLLSFRSGYNPQGQPIQRSIINVGASNDTKIYPLPTGSVEIGIKVVGEQSGGEDEDKSTSGNFTLGTKYVATAGYEPVNVITITSTSPITKAWTANLDFDYEDADGTHTLLNSNYSIPAGSKYQADGVEYYGVTLNGGVRLKITTIRKFIVS